MKRPQTRSKKNPRSSKLVTAQTFDADTLREQIICDAKVIGVPDGAAEAIATKIATKVTQWIAGRSAVTNADLDRKIALEAKSYSPDLAYVYQNRGKII